MQKFKKGDIVYVNSDWNTAEKCEILDFIPNESSTGVNIYKIHSLDNYGTFAATEDCVFATNNEAAAAHNIQSETLIERYKSEIQNLTDLLNYPLKHCLCTCECDYYEALTAYKTRAAELTGIVLE